MFKQDITIYNIYEDKETGQGKYKRTVLKGHWESEQTIRMGSVKFTTENTTLVVIPYTTKNYIRPQDFDGSGNTWTLFEQDIIVKGIGPETITSINDLKRFTDKAVITGVSITDYALDNALNNFTIRGK